MSLNIQDFRTILTYYNKKIPSSSKKIREEAEQLLSSKLCRCIKKVKKHKKKEGESIGICKRSVLHKKNVDIHGFECKKNKGFHKFPNSRTMKIKKYVKNTKHKGKTKKNK